MLTACIMQNLALYSITKRDSYLETAKEQGDEALGEPISPNEKIKTRT
jgi:hypothetical protein